MPIIKPNSKPEKTKVKIEIDVKLYSEIKKYCDWVKADMNTFFEQAAGFVLKKDKDFNKFKTKNSI